METLAVLEGMWKEMRIDFWRWLWVKATPVIVIAAVIGLAIFSVIVNLTGGF